MQDRLNPADLAACGGDSLKLRVYTSRLLGQESSLVLHGGGNTSVKAAVQDFFGRTQQVLYVKGSGWDLGTIEARGFAAVKMDVLLQLAALPRLPDADMVLQQRAALLDPNAPNPSVEAILHALIPFKFVDHSHADAVVTLTNNPDGIRHVRAVYGDEVLIVPYVMPGFVLARKIRELTRTLDWKKCQGLVLLNHGLFTFADDAAASYRQHIRLVSRAEAYLKKKKIKLASARAATDLIGLAKLRHAVAKAWGGAVVASLTANKAAAGFSNLRNVASLATRGPLTPDHVIRTKSVPVIVGQNPARDVHSFATKYRAYFDRHARGNQKCLDLAPRWAVWPGHGLVSFGRTYPDARITTDIVTHTIAAIQIAEGLGGWKVLPEKKLFEMEYWELELAKLGKGGKGPELQGKIALVCGSISGIGKACVEALLARGAHVAALDIRPEIVSQFQSPNVLPLVCNIAKDQEIAAAVDATVRYFGGLDIVVSNAGIFPPSEAIADLTASTWDRSLAINLTGHQRLMTAAIKYLALGVDPTVVLIGSKNVTAPGPGAAAYSVAKAGVTQLARVAALELGAQGIRVNVVHPNQVFDTGIWTQEVLAARAKHYGLSVEDYMTNNILKTTITSRNVADLVCTLAGPVFHQTTGAQIPIDGGNDRVI